MLKVGIRHCDTKIPTCPQSEARPLSTGDYGFSNTKEFATLKPQHKKGSDSDQKGLLEIDFAVI